jgi:hypothetical protein
MTKNEKPMFIRERHIMFRSKAKADATQSYFGDDAPVTVIPNQLNSAPSTTSP